jgi:hypothetical protein
LNKRGFFDSIRDAFTSAGKSIATGVTSAANTVGDRVVSTANTVADGTVKTANTVADGAKDVGLKVQTHIINIRLPIKLWKSQTMSKMPSQQTLPARESSPSILIGIKILKQSKTQAKPCWILLRLD